MADDGYLIGFEDSSGNFVEVGRFNNQSQNTSDPVFIEHTGSGTRMELDGSGFDMNAGDITNAGSVSTDDLTTNGQSGIEAPQDVGGSRSFGSVETNTTGNPIQVSINLFIGPSNVSAGDDVRITGSVNSDTIDADSVLNAGGSEPIQMSVDLLVPDGVSYVVKLQTDDTGTASITSGRWYEQRIGI